YFVGQSAAIILIVISEILLMFAVLEVYRRLSKEHQNNSENEDEKRKREYQQLESLLSIFFTIKPELPLPDTKGWAAAPDLLKKIAEIILLQKPEFVVETGSGASTVIIAYCLKKIGKGKLLSLEHDTKYAETNRNQIAFHGLDGIATIIHAPLKEIEINNRKWMWYNIESFNVNKPIDVLVIDGPPGYVQKLSRYPAIPILYAHLNDRSKIIVDDGRRDDEKTIVALWEKEFEGLQSEFFETENGAFVITKNSGDTNQSSS
ncbi:MAG TPA: class I SAM-dependent methyltransferase, partial [Acidobacteriota bacterium]